MAVFQIECQYNEMCDVPQVYQGRLRGETVNPTHVIKEFTARITASFQAYEVLGIMATG